MPLELAPPPRSRLRIAVGAAVVLVIAGLTATVLASMLAPRGAVAELLSAPALTIETNAPGASGMLVHVLGAVVEPGVHRLAAGARVLDALAAAGGPTADADLEAVNLVRELADAEQVRIPRLGEPPFADGSLAVPGVTASGLVDLNTADQAALETLPRIGPATAQRIIRWREDNGGFQAVEDLLAVSGIGVKTFESLRELVTV